MPISLNVDAFTSSDLNLLRSPSPDWGNFWNNNSATTKLIFRKVSLDLINSELIKFNNKLSSKTNQEFDKKIVKNLDISIDNLSYKYPNTKNLIIQNLDLKIKNFKAFYINASTNQILNKYSVINLQFDNQVVCVKI